MVSKWDGGFFNIGEYMFESGRRPSGFEYTFLDTKLIYWSWEDDIYGLNTLNKLTMLKFGR